MAKWPNHFISGKQFCKKQNLADLALKRPNGNHVLHFIFLLISHVKKLVKMYNVTPKTALKLCHRKMTQKTYFY